MKALKSLLTWQTATLAIVLTTSASFAAGPSDFSGQSSLVGPVVGGSSFSSSANRFWGGPLNESLTRPAANPKSMVTFVDNDGKPVSDSEFSDLIWHRLP